MTAFRRRPEDEFLSIKFRVHGRQVLRNTGTNDRREAMKFARDLKKQLVREHFAPPAPRTAETSTLTLRQFAALPTRNSAGGRAWSDPTGLIAKYREQESTLNCYLSRTVALLTFAPLADVPLGAIDEDLVERYTEHRTLLEKSAVTTNKDLTALRLILGRAATWKLITRVPEMPWLKRRDPKERVGKAVTHEEEKAYIAVADPDLVDFWHIMVHSSAEPGPVAGLAWADVHFTPTAEYKRGWFRDRCHKGPNRDRALPMSMEVRRVLQKRWMAQGCPETGWVFPSDRNGRTHPTPPSTFRTAHKRLWSSGKLTIRRFRLYDARHTIATRLADAGTTVYVLKDTMGWSSLDMADVYVKRNEAGKGRAIEALDAYNAEKR